MERFEGVGVDLEETVLVDGLPRLRGVVGWWGSGFFRRFGGFGVEVSSEEE